MKTSFDEQEYYDETFGNVKLETGEILTAYFSDCIFVQCVFREAVLRNCRFVNCTFRDCDLSLANITGSAFPGTVFKKSRLIGVNWTQGDWSVSGFQKFVGFTDCVLSHGTFIGLEIPKLKITNCIAQEVDFRDANLSKVDFKGTDLSGSIFGKTNLTKADLSEARNYEINPDDNELHEAIFSLPEAMSLLYQMDIVLKEF